MTARYRSRPMRQVVGDVPLGGSPFPPIADFAFLSDCESCALVAPSGNVEWMCLPRFDSPSVFGAILDREGLMAVSCECYQQVRMRTAFHLPKTYP